MGARKRYLGWDMKMATLQEPTEMPCVSSVRSYLVLPSASAAFLRGLLFDSEDGRDMLLRNVGVSPGCKVLQLQVLHSFFSAHA